MEKYFLFTKARADIKYEKAKVLWNGKKTVHKKNHTTFISCEK